MLRTARLLPLAGLLTLGFDHRRFQRQPPVCYWAPWRLPRPDFHRLATMSLRWLSSDYSIANLQLWTHFGRASRLLSHPGDEWRLAPGVFQRIVLPVILIKDVDHHVGEVNQDPT